MKNRRIYLAFELENFSFPKEFGGVSLSEAEGVAATKSGLKLLLPVLLKHKVNATFFSSASYAAANKSVIQEISANFDVALNEYSVKNTDPVYIENEKEVLETILKRSVRRIVFPKISQFDTRLINEAGHLYDSVISLSEAKGSNTKSILNKTSYSETQFLRFSVSTNPTVQFPVFWLSFKNLPYWYYKKMATKSLYKDGYLKLFFLPWEFADLDQVDLPGYIKKISGKKLANRLDRFLGEVKSNTEFCTLPDLVA